MKLSKNANVIKLVNKIIPRYNRTRSASILKSRSRNNFKQIRPRTALNSQIIKKNILNKTISNKNINKYSTENLNLNVLNLMIEHNPLQYNYNKLKEKAKQINSIFKNDNKIKNIIINNMTKNTQNVLYRYNILYGNNTPNIITTYSPKMRPMSSSVKVFLKTIKDTTEDKHILNDKEILLLIKAKCKDIGIDFRESMYIKFKDFCNSKCKNRIADFSECYFGINSVKIISDILLIPNRISRLNLTKNNIGDKGLEILVNAVKYSISLVSLNITSNSITYKGGNIIFKSFINQQSIIDLNISSIEGSNRNRLTAEGIKDIVIFLTRNIFIEILNLSGNSIRNEGFFLLCKGLRKNVSLQNLDISNNDIHEKGINRGIDYINKLKIYSKINTVNISNNPILNGGIISITKNLRYFPNLKSINVSFCGIEFKGFNLLLKTIQYIKRIESLNVSGNKIKDENFSDIKPYFSVFSLRYLNMSKCSLGDRSGYILGECLAVNETLKYVNISGNEITDKGFKSYVNLFKSNISIEYFDCSSNFITDYTGKDFVKSLIYNQTLKSINFYDNQLHDEIGSLFFDVLEINKNLVHINLNYNRIQVKTIEDLNKILKINYDKQKNSFIPDLVRNIKDLEFQPEQFSILSKKILEKKNLQNFLYKKVQQDDKNFCSLLNIENKKLEKEEKRLMEIINQKKEYETKILEKTRGIENNEKQKRLKEDKIKIKILDEKKILEELKEENDNVLKEYNKNKNQLMLTFEKTEQAYNYSKDKLKLAKKYYEMKDKEYIEKFSYYQDLINPDLLVLIKKQNLIKNKNKKNVNYSAGNIKNDDNVNDNENEETEKYKKIEDYKSNIKSGKVKIRNNSKRLHEKKNVINKQNMNNAISTSDTISNGNINYDEKLMNSTFNRTFKFNKKKKK